MYSTKSFVAAAAAFSLIASSAATYDPTSRANLAMYWGQGPDQADLATYCDEATVDVIPIAFIVAFPPQANGIVGANYGNQCGGNSFYNGPGYMGAAPVAANNNLLPSDCGPLQEAIHYCQTQTKKKILLSLGGQSGGYGLNNAADGIYLADFLWGAYGPYNQTWVDNGGIRPLDRGGNNITTADTVDFDGFDFDIEQSSGDQLGYVACITRLRALFADYKKQVPCSKDYIISGAPQCPLPETNMGVMIAQAQFDILWIQFYNNDGYGCSAINYTTQGTASNFNFAPGTTGWGATTYGNWATTVASGLSKNAKIYLGLLGGPTASSSPQDFLTPAQAKSLIDAFQGTTNFGGVMLWEATAASAVDMSQYAGFTAADTYYAAIKSFLTPYAPATTVTASVCTSTTSTKSSSTSSSTSTTTSSTISTTSSSVTVSSTSSIATTSSAVETSSSTSAVETSSSTSAVETSSSTSAVETSSSTSAVETSSSTSAVETSSSTSAVETSSSTSAVETSSSTSAVETSSSTSAVETSSSTSADVTSSSSSAVETSSSSSSSDSTTVTTSSSASATDSGVTTSASATSSVISLPAFTDSSLSLSATSATGGDVTSSSTSSTAYTTSTVLTTSVYTITSCAPTVTDCPAQLGSVTTEVITLYTTVCPVTATETDKGFTYSTMAPAPTTTLYTTSTVYTTNVYTITSCAATVTDCPAKLGSVTTEVVKLYTTVCPVAEATSEATKPISSGVDKAIASSTIITTTKSSTTTLYRTVVMMKSTATVVPTSAPYPTGSAVSKPFATGLPSVSVVFQKQASTSTAAGAAGTTTASPVPTTFAGAASSPRGGMCTLLVALFGVVALLI